MLKPAIIYIGEIYECFQEYFYTEDMMYESGDLDNWIPDILDCPDGSTYQYAILDSHENLIGYFSYYVDWYSSCAYNFGLMSFDRGNPTIGREVFGTLESLISSLHRIEWIMIGGNPAERSYDKFCENHNGTKHILKDYMKDKSGNYRDKIVYEIINKNNK